MKPLSDYIAEELDEDLIPNKGCLVEMAKTGTFGLKNIVYQTAIWGDPTADRDAPHLHVYLADDAKNKYKNFTLEVSVRHILAEDKWVLLRKWDRTQKPPVDEMTPTEDWGRYKKILDPLKSFLFGKPVTLNGRRYLNIFQYALAQWNSERDFNAVQQGRNPLKEWMAGQKLEILPKYKGLVDGLNIIND